MLATFGKVAKTVCPGTSIMDTRLCPPVVLSVTAAKSLVVLAAIDIVVGAAPPNEIDVTYCLVAASIKLTLSVPWSATST